MWLGLALFMLGGFASSARAADYQNLPVVKPVVSCDQLAKMDLSTVAGATVTIKTATVTDTPKGQFCKITGTIDPAIGFEVDLPVEHWTQRYAQAGCGAYCGNININISQASACLPALNGEFASASDDMGHEGGMNSPGGDSAFGADPQKKIDFAYRGNHETTLVSKALIKAFYGQPQKYAYFVGCSDGGREALTEAQRFPNDFDGISAGAPVAIINVHNSFFHGGWEAAVDKRADGSTILYRERISILHDAVVAHCGHDGTVILDPFGCKFNPAWVECAPGSADTSKCLTSEEIGVVKKLYDGPADAAGHLFEIAGYVPGTEPQMNIPSQTPNTRTGGPGGGGGGMTASSLKYLLLPTVTDDGKNFQLTEDWFKKVAELAPLYNAANTDLRPFEEHGGKLIVWHGGADTSVPPTISVAYYQGVQKQLGVQTTDHFMKLFILPGVGHCGGGDGPSQVDVLTPLMAWTELHRPPTKLIAGKTAGGSGPGFGGPGPVGPGPGVGQGGPGMGAPPQGAAGQGAPNGVGGQGGPDMAGGPGGPGGPGGSKYPYPSPAQPTTFARPLYPYPYIARYSGNGDPTDAANYEPVKSSAPDPLVFNTEATTLIGPDNQKFYHVENGQLVADAKK
jgi:feruloyl esterase